MVFAPLVESTPLAKIGLRESWEMYQRCFKDVLAQFNDGFGTYFGFNSRMLKISRYMPKIDFSFELYKAKSKTNTITHSDIWN